MSKVQVQLVQADGTITLVPGTNQQAISERPALLTVRNASADVFLDDSQVSMQVVGEARVATIDLLNQAGMHRLRIGSGPSSVSFDFVTETAKANWAEIQAMVAATRTFSTERGRPFLYAGRGGNADLTAVEKLTFWLRERADDVSLLIRAIDKAPASRTQPRLVLSTRARGLDRRATAALLRERPQLLESSPTGGVVVDGERYWPSMVRVREHAATRPVLEHQRIRQFARRLIRISHDLSLLDPTLRTQTSALQGAGTVRLFAETPPSQAAPYVRQPSEIERRDTRYARLRQLSAEFESNLGIGDLTEGIRAGIKETWEVYQCFAAHVIGEALELDCVSPTRDLRERDADGASMRNGDIALYYDTQPPSAAMQSWRATTSRPAGERPDILVIDMASRRCILLDVKFSIDPAGRSRSEHLFEMQGYLNSYGVARGGIVFPGAPAASSISAARGFAIHEVPLAARSLVADPGAFMANLRIQLASLWTPLP